MTDFWQGKRVLVTGGNGFLGTCLVRRLGERGGAMVQVVGREVCDLRDPVAARDTIRGFDPDIVFHLASRIGGIKENIAKPASFIRDTLRIGLNVLDACLDRSDRKIVIASSACAYPGVLPDKATEDQIWDGPPEVSNGAYGVAKRTLMKIAEAYGKQFGLRYNVLIPTNLYGPGDRSSHVIPDLIVKFSQAAASGDGFVKCMGSGRAVREFLYVEDAAQAFIDCAERCDSSLPMNIGSGETISIFTLARKIAMACGYNGEIGWDEAGPNGQLYRALNSDRARSQFGFVCKTTLDKGLEYAVEAYMKSRDRNIAPVRLEG